MQKITITRSPDFLKTTEIICNVCKKVLCKEYDTNPHAFLYEQKSIDLCPDSECTDNFDKADLSA